MANLNLSADDAADFALLEYLADGRFHSGSALGEALSISRAAVWKRISRLIELGLAVDSVRGKGYRLASPLDMIVPQRLADSLPDEATVSYRLVTDSTNSEAMASHRSGRHWVIAEAQRAGRGRRGRQWQSPLAGNIYCSVRAPMACGVAGLSGLSLAVGVAVCDALVALYPALPVALKWPNDIWLNDEKLGGILIEVAGEMEQAAVVVIGIGVNVHLPSDAAAQIDQPWTDLRRHCQEVSRTVLAGTLMAHVETTLNVFDQDGFAPFQARFERYDACVGRDVVVSQGKDKKHGVVQGVTQSGALRLDCDGKETHLNGGEISLRLA